MKKAHNLEDALNHAATVVELVSTRPLTKHVALLGELRKLQIHHSELPKEVCELPKLEALSVVGVDKVPETVLSMKGLKSLVIKGPVDVVPEGISALTKLRKLVLRGTRIESLPESMAQLKSLAQLDLSETKNLTSIPDVVFSLKNLSKLDLSFGGIEGEPRELALPVNFDQLKLVDLDLAGNLLPSLSPVYQLRTLKSLTLQFMRLSEISTEIGDLRKLTKLDLSNNRLTELPATIGKLAELTSLALDQNDLGVLPASITELRKLKTLKLAGNPNLRSLPPGILDMPALAGSQRVKLELLHKRMAKQPIAADPHLLKQVPSVCAILSAEQIGSLFAFLQTDEPSCDHDDEAYGRWAKTETLAKGVSPAKLGEAIYAAFGKDCPAACPCGIKSFLGIQG